MATRKNVKADARLVARIIKDSPLMLHLPNPDELIARSPRGLLTYDDILIDGRVSSLFRDRLNATQNLPMSMSAVDDPAVQEYAERYLSEKALRKWANYLLKGALKYGFRPAEVIWQQDPAGYLYIDALIGHRITSYRFDADGRMYYTQYGSELLDEPNKWIVHRQEGDSYNDPYGDAYLKTVYWYWQFKRMGWQYWLTATEKFAVPSILALFEQSDPAKAQAIANELATIIAEISSSSSGALANVKGVQQINMGGSVSDFDVLIKACDLQISYAMTGQALATSVSDTGTQALGTVQERTKTAAYENDSRALAYTLQKLVEMAVEVNFGPDAVAPKFSYDTGDYASFGSVIQAIGAGVPVSKAALYSRYGLPEPEDEEDAFVQQGGGGGTGMPFGPFDFADTLPEGKKKVRRPMILIR